MFTKEQMNQMLEEVKPQIIESMKKEIRGEISYEIKTAVKEEIKKCICEFMEKEIIPEITKKLLEEKEGLIQIGIKIMPEMVNLISMALLEELKQNIESSYSRDKIIKALFD